MRRFDDTRVMVLANLASESPKPFAAGFHLTPVSHEIFAQTVGMMRGSALAQRQAHAERLASSPVPFRAWVLRHEGQPIACGQSAIESRLVGLYDIFTAEHMRGQGLARSLCSHLLAYAGAQGATTGYLQVDADNMAARSIYHSLGFRDGYAYHYRTSTADV